ncbi:MAG: O-antigen ligase family protein [Cyanobacteria bacterium P01_D01_bin.6]
MFIQNFIISTQALTKPIFDFVETAFFAKLEKAFVLIFLILYSQAITILVLTGAASEGDGNIHWNLSILTVFWFLNYLLTLILFILKWRVVRDKLISVICHNYFLWVFLMYALLSVNWSEKPDETLKGAIALIGTVMFGVYIVCRYSFKEQINIIVSFFSIILVMSILFIFIPGYGIQGAKHAGAIRGVFNHKNIFGQIITLSTATFLLYSKTNFCPDKRLAYLGFTASFILVVASRSSSSLLYTVLLIALIHAVQVLRFRGQLFIWCLGTFAGSYFFIATWRQTVVNYVLNLLGKDPTLTGRTDIWDVILSKIQEKIWFGYGLDAFWHGIYGESFYIINAVRWELPSAHNGFLDLTLHLGVVGLGLLMLTVWITFVKVLAILKTNFSWPHVWPFMFISYTFMINMSESFLGVQNNIQTVFLAIACTSTSVEFSKMFGATPQLKD